MRILHRYVLREVAAASLVGTLLFTLVLFLQRLEPVMELLVGRGAPIGEMLRLFALTIPQAFPFTIPMGVLTGILVSIGRLASDNEIVAMTSCGVRGSALARPVALVATLGLATCAATTLWLTPWSLREQVHIADSFRIHLAGSEVQPRVFIEDFPEQVIWVQDVVPGEGVHWRQIFIADMRTPEARGSLSGFNASPDGPRITLASEAFVLPRPEQNRIQIRFPLTTTYEQSSDPEHYLAVRSESADQVLQAQPRQFDRSVRRYDRMDTLALMEAARNGEEPLAGILLHERFALPFACWVLPLAGLPLAVSARSSGRSAGIVLAMLLCFAYWMVSLAGGALTEQSGLAPSVAAWSANGIFAVLGLLMLGRIDIPSSRSGRLAWTRRLTRRALRIAAINRRRRRRRIASERNPHHGQLNLRIRVVDRYVLRKFLFYLTVFVVMFIGIWYVFSFFELLNDMLSRDRLGQFVPYLYYLTPFLVYNTTPLAVLIATLVCFGLLARQHELTAFRACGVSLYRLALPVLVVSAGLSGGLLALEETYLPEANRRQDALRDEIKGRPPRTYLRPDRQWTFGMQDRIFFHRAFDSTSQVFSGIDIYDLRREPFELRRHVHADSARWDPSRDAWVFKNGWVRDFSGIETDRFLKFEEQVLPSIRERPDYFLKPDHRDQQMNLAELKAYIVDLTQSGFDTIRLRVSLHKKLSFPFFAFSMALLAIPFAMQTGTRSTMWPVCFGLGMVVTYYASNAFAEQLGRTGQLEPVMAAWAPCLLFAIGGAYLMLRVRT